jgi:hypothetical protein
MDLAQFKSKYIRQIKALYTDRVIYPEYPVFKQQNVDGQRCGYVAQDKTDMDTFISGKVTDISGLEADVNALADTEILDDFSMSDSDANRFAYVASYLTSCTTDEKKLICVLALQDIKAFNL